MIYSFFFLPELGQHLSGLIWAVMLVSAAIVITLPRESGVRTFVASTILRMIFSVGPEPTLITLGTITVSHVTVLCLKDRRQNRVKNIVIRMQYSPRSCRWAGMFEVSGPVVFWSCMQMVFVYTVHTFGDMLDSLCTVMWANNTMRQLFRLLIFLIQPYVFRATNSPILRSTYLTVYTAFGTMHCNDKL